MLRGLLYILLFSFFSGSSQTTLGWYKMLDGASESEKAGIYLRLGNELANKFGYADSLLYYSEKAYSISKKTGSVQLQNEALLSLGIAYQKINLYDTSSIILSSLLNTMNDAKAEGDVLCNLGLNEYRRNNNKVALQYYLTALEKYNESSYPDGRALVFCRISALFNNERQNNDAIAYLNKAKNELGKIKEEGIKIQTLSAITGLYDQLAVNEKTFTDSSLSYAKKALDLMSEFGYFARGNQLCLSVSKAYRSKHDSINALLYCERATKFRNYLLPNEILINYIEFSDCYNMLGNNKMALVYLDSVKGVVQKLNDPYYWMVYYERQYIYNKSAGNLKFAIEGLEKFKSVQDSLYNLEKTSALNELEERYNKSENERKIEDLNRKNEIASLNVKFLVAGILASVLIIVVIIFFYRQSVFKNKFKALETEQRLNRARMDPHFFFNALSSIQTLSMDEENNKKVSSFISKFSKIIRQSLESTYDELITVEEEVSFLTNYLDLQKLRYNNKFDYEIKVDDNVRQDELKVLGMLLQPFIENSIEHGFKNIDYKGLLTISFMKAGNSLKVELRDNGAGFNTDILHKEYPSRATQIINDRLMLLNKRQKTNSGYKLGKNPEGKGILVEVILPIIT